MNIEEVREYCLTLPYVTEDEFFPRVAVKCDPAQAIELRERYRGVEPAYHMNKKMWNDVYLNRDLEGKEIEKWINLIK